MYYSQFGEDKYIHENYFKGVRNGVFCELGAMNGVKYSNSLFFEKELGWSGHLIEPHPGMFDKLKKNRPKAKCYNYAITQTPGPIDFLVNDSVLSVCVVAEGMSKKQYEKWHTESKVIQVPGVRFDSIIDSKTTPKIDFFSIDVEGKEFDVLATFDWSIEVSVILIEMLDHFYKEINDKCRKLLRDKGFVFKEKRGLNEIYVKGE
jgi:FkbM family methyltransferase